MYVIGDRIGHIDAYGVQHEFDGIELPDFVGEVREKLLEQIRKQNRVVNNKVLLLLYKPKYVPEMVGSIHLPEHKIDNNSEYSSNMGMVVSMGKYAFGGQKKYSLFGWGFGKKELEVNIGDWVYFPRSTCYQYKNREIPLVLISDDKILAAMDDPSTIGK